MNPKPKPDKKHKKSKKPVKRVSSKGARKKYAHSLLRDIVRIRDVECVCPAPEKGHSAVLQAGHLIPGTKGGTYFDLWNVSLQCSACNGRHVRYEKYYVGWFIREFGQEAYLRLVNDSDDIGLKSYELEEVIFQLEAIKVWQFLDLTFKPRFTQKEILSGSWSMK